MRGPRLSCSTISWSRIAKPLIHTNIHLDFGRVFAHVKISRLIDQLSFILCDPLTKKQVLGPGRHHDLDMEAVGPGRIGKQLPAVRSVPQINQPQLVHKRVELGPSTLVQLDIDRNRTGPSAGRGT